MDIKSGMELWNEKHPVAKVTAQTVRNWASRLNLGKKQNGVFPRCKWQLDEKKFAEFVANPDAYLKRKEKTK